MKLCLVVSTILAVLNGSVAARLGLRSAEDPEWCKNGMDPENYSLVNSVCEECADVFRNHPGVYGLCKMNCFGTTLYKDCVDILMIEEGLKGELVKYIDDAHFGASVFNKK